MVVLAKARPSPSLDIGELSRAMDELDHRIRRELPFVAEVFIDVTAHGAGKKQRPARRPSDGR